MRSLLKLPVVLLLCVVVLAQTVDVGSGAPTGLLTQLFIAAWTRNGFYLLVSVPPIANVRKFGATGYVQEFQDAAKNTGVKLALVTDTNLDAVYQETAAMYTFYNATGTSTAGYPTMDTTNCPTLRAASNAQNSCQYQLFDKPYALFTYSQLALLTSQTFAIRDPFYTKWSNFGNVSGLGPADGAETSVTSSFNSQGTLQTYDQGAIYNITSGTLNGRILAIKEPIYDLFVSNGAHGGSLGMPVTEELVLPSGLKEQQFEGGAIEYDPATNIPILLPPVASIQLQPSAPVSMKLGDTLSVQATLTSSTGTTLTDRTVVWNTTNGNVVQIQSSGLNATLKAVGGGVATITATSGGKTSAGLIVNVTSPCCQIGEGAPASVQPAFQSAVARDKLNILLPAASAATRVGNGYVQQLLSTDNPPISYLVTVSDGSGTGYIVTGAILTAYTNLGGPAGSLGYPLSDATPGGRQTFQRGTLAGSPVQLVTGSILTKWGALGYETGIAGSPTSATSNFLTFRATSGVQQSFQGALILVPNSNVFAVTGLILAQYSSNGAVSGALGAPASDEYTASSGLRHQDFEGGYMEYAPGASSANVVITSRQPIVTVTPSSVISGSFVHLTVGGFNNNTNVRVSITGQPDFLATLTSGAYTWDVYVPPSASSGTVTVRATQVGGTLSAQASYTVRTASSVVMTLTALSGDAQTGTPSTPLALPLVVELKDNLGNPAPNQPVTFTASPGAQIISASPMTNANGQASATLRLPAAEGVALATATAAHQVVTFSARSVAFSLTNFPALTQAVNGTLGNGTATIRAKGSLLTAAAAILNYHQTRGELPSPNGLADPVTLNAFLKSYCVSDSQANQTCDGFVSLGANNDQTVNLWRLGAFVAGNIDVSVEQTDLNILRALVASGSPVLLALSLASNQGSHFVVATGIASDGSLIIFDPDPSFGHTNLNDYLNGVAILTGAVRLLPRAPASPGFLTVTNVDVAVSSVAGACGTTLAFPDTAAIAGSSPTSAPGTLYFHACDGAAGLYQFDVGNAYTGLFDDLSAANTHIILSSASAISSEIARNAGVWTIRSLQTSISTGGIVNAATLTSDIAPGGIISIFGAGFVSAGSSPGVTINTESAKVLAAFPFQINAQIPADAVPGAASLVVTSPNGSASQQISIQTVAPAIFSISTGQAAITNQDNTLNTPSNPALRGASVIIYATGFGTVGSSGGLNPVHTPLTVVIGVTELIPAFAGLTPGAIGLYQVNVALPSTLAPGLFLPLYLKQAGVNGNTVTVAVQ